MKLLFFLLLISCRPTEEQVNPSSKVVFKSAAGVNFTSGGLYIFGNSTDGNGITNRFAFQLYSDYFERNIPNGRWRFYGLAWDGSNPLEGTIRCYVSNLVDLNGGEFNVQIQLNQNKCDNALFGSDIVTRNGSYFYTLNIASCDDISAAFADPYSCPGNAGIAQSVSLILPTYFQFKGEKRIEFANSLSSNCYNLSGGMVNTDIKIPVGATITQTVSEPKHT